MSIVVQDVTWVCNRCEATAHVRYSEPISILDALPPFGWAVTRCPEGDLEARCPACCEKAWGNQPDDMDDWFYKVTEKSQVVMVQHE